MYGIQSDIPEYPAKPYQQQKDEGYTNPLGPTRELVPLIVHHSGRDGGPFAIAAYAQRKIIFGSKKIEYVLIIEFVGGKKYRYPALTAPTPEAMQAILDANQGTSLSLSCNPKSSQANPVFLRGNYVRSE